MAIPMLNYPDMAGQAADMYTRGVSLGDAQRRNRLLVDAGQQASRGEMPAAKNTLLAGGDFQQADQLQRSIDTMQDRDLEHASRVQQHLSNIASTIRSPQDFEKAKMVLGRMGLPVDGYTYDMLPTLRAQATTEAERYSRALNERKMRMEEAQARQPKTMEVGGSLVRVDPEGGVSELYRAPPAAKADQPKTFEVNGRLVQQLPDGSVKELYAAPPKPTQLMAADRKEIFESDAAAQAGESAIGQLQRALELNDKAYYGFAPETRGYLTSLYGSEGGTATEELANTITTQALDQLKAVFGGMPTEGERQILLQVQGAVNQAPQVRAGIYQRAIEAAKRRIDFNKRQSEGLRSGQYYQPGYSPVTVPGADYRASMPGQTQQQSPAVQPNRRPRYNPQTGEIE